MTPPTAPNPGSNTNVQELVPVLAPALVHAIIPSLRDEFRLLMLAMVAETLQPNDDEPKNGPTEERNLPDEASRSKTHNVAGRDTVVSDNEILRRARVLETHHIEEEDGRSTNIEVDSDGTYGGWRVSGATGKEREDAGNDGGGV